MSAVETEKATSLRRGVSILMALASDEALDGEGLGVVRLAELVGSDKSRVSRTLRTLAQYELVDRDAESLAYRLGWALFALARRSADARLLHEGARAAQELVREFDEAAHLSVRLDVEVLTAVSRAPQRALKAAGWAGRTVPIHCTSAGRALLLDHDAAALERLLDGVDLTVGGPRAPKDVAELGRRIARDRRNGFVTVDEESEPGVVGAAAPVRDFTGDVVAALNLSAPKFRFEERLPQAALRVKAVADDLSRKLGWDVEALPGASGWSRGGRDSA